MTNFVDGKQAQEIEKMRIENMILMAKAVRNWTLSLGVVLSLLVNVVDIFLKLLYPHITVASAKAEVLRDNMVSNGFVFLKAIGIENYAGITITIILILFMIFWKDKADKKEA